jgi:hypothetical protein
MSAMTTSLAASRILLLADDKPTAPRDPAAVKVRRYRLAKVHLNEVRDREARFEHLKRTYD